MKYDIIQTKDYLLVLDYKDVQPGDSFLLNFDHPNGRIRRCHRVYDNDKEDLLMIDPVEFGFLYRRECKRISAHLPLNGAPYLDGVDVLPSFEDEAEKIFPVGNHSLMHMPNRHQLDNSLRQEGYNIAREKYNLTLEKLIDMYIEKTGYGMDMWSKEENETMSTIADIIQSLHQPKLPISFECEMEPILVKDKYGHQILGTYAPKIIINSEGRTEWVGNWIWN